MVWQEDASKRPKKHSVFRLWSEAGYPDNLTKGGQGKFLRSGRKLPADWDPETERSLTGWPVGSITWFAYWEKAVARRTAAAGVVRSQARTQS